MAIYAAPFDKHWPPEIQKVFPFISKVQKIVKTEQKKKMLPFWLFSKVL